jgi:hypothetical protein
VKRRVLFLVMALLLTMGSPVSADSIDVSTSFGDLYALSMKAAPEQSGIVLLLDYAIRNQELEEVPDKGDGTMEEVGDYRVFEGRRSTVVLGLGYEVGFITPWVGFASQKVRSKEERVEYGQEADSEGNSRTVIGEKNTTELTNGVAVGISAEYGEGPWSFLGTAAKLPEGLMLSVRVKYHVGIGTAHAGYMYNGHTGHGIMVGLGLAY